MVRDNLGAMVGATVDAIAGAIAIAKHLVPEGRRPEIIVP